jgi:hypothetical protein
VIYYESPLASRSSTATMMVSAIITIDYPLPFTTVAKLSNGDATGGGQLCTFSALQRNSASMIGFLPVAKASACSLPNAARTSAGGAFRSIPSEESICHIRAQRKLSQSRKNHRSLTEPKAPPLSSSNTRLHIPIPFHISTTYTIYLSPSLHPSKKKKTKDKNR